MMSIRAVLSLAVTGALCGCSTPGPSPLPVGPSAYAVVPERAPQELVSDAIKPGDRLAIRVFGEPELTGDNYVVDGSGYLQLPLIGELIAVQQSPRMVAAEIERRLQARFVRNASVTVSVIDRPHKTPPRMQGRRREPGEQKPPRHPPGAEQAIAQREAGAALDGSGRACIQEAHRGILAFAVAALRSGANIPVQARATTSGEK